MVSTYSPKTAVIRGVHDNHPNWGSWCHLPALPAFIARPAEGRTAPPQSRPRRSTAAVSAPTVPAPQRATRSPRTGAASWPWEAEPVSSEPPKPAPVKEGEVASGG